MAFEVERIFLGGGGARSRLWLQIHADILKKTDPASREKRNRVRWARRWRPQSPPGVYPDFDEAARAMVAIETRRRARSAQTRAFTTSYSDDMSTSTRG